MAEGAYAVGCFAFPAIEAQGKAEKDQPDPALFHDFGDALEGIDPAGVNGFHRMRRDSQLIGGGETDPSLAVIDGENGVVAHGECGI